MDVKGKRVIVTGAGHGIGRAIAVRMASAGARVVVNDLDAEAATAVAQEIGGHPDRDGAADPVPCTGDNDTFALHVHVTHLR